MCIEMPTVSPKCYAGPSDRRLDREIARSRCNRHIVADQEDLRADDALPESDVGYLARGTNQGSSTARSRVIVDSRLAPLFTQ